MGCTFQVLIDHVPADAGLAKRLQEHLASSVHKGQVRLLLPEGVAPGLVAANEAREAIFDADLVVVLLSATFLANEHAYARLRLASTRHRERLLQLCPVVARPCNLEADDLPPGVRTLPTGAAVSTFKKPDDACAAIVAAIQQVLDVLERQPYGPHPTLRRVATEAFRLDRTHQWEEMRARCQGREHTLFFLHGRRGQAVSLFAERACQLLGHEGTPLRLLQVPIRHGIVHAHDVENRLRGVLATALGTEADSTEVILQRLSRKGRLLLLLGGVQNERWPLRERQALADFLTQRLPALLPRDGHPVLALLLLEYDRPEASLLSWVNAWATALQGPLHFRQLPEATLPTWDEVAEVLERKGASAETTAALRAFYDELTRGDAPSFEELATELDAYLI